MRGLIQVGSMDAAQTGWLHSMWPPLILAILWIVVAGLLPLLVTRGQRRLAVMALAAAGVPLLGWLTYGCGPAVGLIGFGLGLALLLVPPLGRLRPGRAT